VAGIDVLITAPLDDPSKWASRGATTTTSGPGEPGSAITACSTGSATTCEKFSSSVDVKPADACPSASDSAAGGRPWEPSRR
jgi:hypothetical protein